MKVKLSARKKNVRVRRQLAPASAFWKSEQRLKKNILTNIVCFVIVVIPIIKDKSRLNNAALNTGLTSLQNHLGIFVIITFVLTKKKKKTTSLV